ncbi:MAG: hypothetical protein JWO94_1970 [Verrucomicrobiaceae bacterium]|nr:hypothetical protein [Verrucomicrobiaceae bacterium]
MEKRLWQISLALVLVIISCGRPEAQAQTEQQIRAAFANIRSDQIPHNGGIAAQWLFNNRDRLRPVLLDELYKTDRQGRDAILVILFQTRGFVGDARFRQLVMTRVTEDERYVHNADLMLSAHWWAWKFIHAHYDQFKPMIVENLLRTNDMMCAWASVWLLSAHHDLTEVLPEFGDHLWGLAERSLMDDHIYYNAGQAVRFYLIIGRPSEPHLRAAKASSDAQTRDLATATLDAMNGSHKAYGYLGAQVAIEMDLLNSARQLPSPDWLGHEIGEFKDGGAKYR